MIRHQVAFFDVNNMKTINDTLGHKADAAALIHVAIPLLQNIRHSDVVHRLNEDEFGVVLSQVGDKGVRNKRDELVQQINSQPVKPAGKSFDGSIAQNYYIFHGSESADDALDASYKPTYE